MPRPGLPPTPGSSTDLKGKDGANQLTSLHLAFELPPPAIHDAARTSPGTSAAAHHHQQMSPPAYPMQAAETVKARRRSSAAAAAAAAKESKDSSFALPPPPTRSRKIIQMKPRSQDDSSSAGASAVADVAAAKENGASGKTSGKAATKTATNTSASGSGAGAGAVAAKGGKKQPSATSAAGRKIARKTAHSLIERRRRSKMNEEFAVLKNMIPACTGDMHKLAILQVSMMSLVTNIEITNTSRPPSNTSATWKTACRSSRRSTGMGTAPSRLLATRYRPFANFTLPFTASQATSKCPTRRPSHPRLLPGQTTTKCTSPPSHRLSTRRKPASVTTRTRPQHRRPSSATTASHYPPHPRRPLGRSATDRTQEAAHPHRRRR